MKQQFVPYEIALKLKESGFDEECFGIYITNDTFVPIKPGTLSIIGPTKKGYVHKNCIPAPLYQQVLQWFRDNHKINIFVSQAWETFDKLNYCYDYVLEMDSTDDDKLTYQYASYEEALNAAIEEALTLI